MNLLKLTKQYRADNSRLNGGYVICYQGEVSGWTSTLNTPASWTPGCIAVAEDGKCYEATGGDDYNGAKSWTLCAAAQGGAA